ncbi:MAG: hypothetical protein IT423_12645, partial [Pirellulaceae bacterium]|nr:hypothetical protein [Pirellulaceae bacterium]
MGLPSAHAEYLHVIFANEKEDPDIAEQCTGAVKAAVGAIANGLPVDLTRLHELEREDLKDSSAFASKIRELSEQISSDDAVLFYYAGHGVINRGKHFMRYKEDCFVERTAAIKAVEATGAKFVLFITDMCANHGQAPIRALGGGCSSCGQGENLVNRIAPAIDRLFFQSTGVFEMSSCSPNE